MTDTKRLKHTVLFGDVLENELQRQYIQRRQLPLIVKMGLPVDLKTKSSAVTFQKCVKLLLIAGQCFALIPVYGVTSKNISDVKYVRISLKCGYTLFSLCGQIFMTTMTVRLLYTSDEPFSSASSVVFFGSSILTMLMFLKIAKRWSKLVRHITKIEDLYPNFDDKLIKKCNTTCFVILFISLMEHLMALAPQVLGGNSCTPSEPLDSYENFLKHIYPWIFDVVPFNLLLGILFEFFQVQATFVWNFSDLFIICLSYYLTSRLNLINKKLLDVHGKALPELFWRSIREEYSRATQLVRRMDDVINGIIFMSFANNLFFICLQLYNFLVSSIRGNPTCRPDEAGANPITSSVVELYFMFSLSYLIVRSVAVSLIAAEVNTASSFPAQVLYDIPSDAYCNEAQRFLAQMTHEKVALTGLQFFSVTRGLLLTVAGTIVTYELVMLQMNSSALPLPATAATTTATAATTMLVNFTTPQPII